MLELGLGMIQAQSLTLTLTLRAAANDMKKKMLMTVTQKHAELSMVRPCQRHSARLLGMNSVLYLLENPIVPQLQP